MAALGNQDSKDQDHGQEERLTRAIENLRKQHLWGDLSDDDPGNHCPKFQGCKIIASHINQEDAWL